MIVAAICPRCSAYRYRTDDLVDGSTPLPEDFQPIEPQSTVATAGHKATCDVCAGDLRFVRGADWDALTRPLARPASTIGAPNGHRASRLLDAPAVIELFRVEANEEVREMRPLASGRILVVTTKRILVVDPNLLDGGALT